MERFKYSLKFCTPSIFTRPACGESSSVHKLPRQYFAEKSLSLTAMPPSTVQIVGDFRRSSEGNVERL